MNLVHWKHCDTAGQRYQEVHVHTVGKRLKVTFMIFGNICSVKSLWRNAMTSHSLCVCSHLNASVVFGVRPNTNSDSVLVRKVCTVHPGTCRHCCTASRAGELT